MFKSKIRYERPFTEIITLEVEHLLQTRGSSFRENGILYIWDVSKGAYINSETGIEYVDPGEIESKPAIGSDPVGYPWSDW